MLRPSVRFAVAATLAVLVSCADDAPAAPGGRSVMLLEPERVEFLHGFEGHDDGFLVWHDYLGANPDRDELTVLMRRESGLRWHTAGPGTLHFGAARFQVGPSGDATPVSVRLRVLDTAGAELHTVAIAPAPLPAAQDVAGENTRDAESPRDDAHAATPDASPRRDPPTVPNERVSAGARMQLELPAQTASLEFTVTSPDGFPEGAFLALLAPWVERDAPVPDSPLVPGDFFASQWLTSLLESPGADVPFGVRLTGDPAAPREEAVSLPGVDDVGSFTGRPGRHALALVDRAVFTCRVDLSSPESRLRGALALDERLPPGARATLRVLVDDALVAELDVSSAQWTPVDVALPRRSSSAALTLALVPAPFAPDLVVRDEPDFAVGAMRPVGWRAGVVRVGFAGARVDSPRARPAPPPGPVRSVLVVHIETLRADVLSPYGGDPSLTPNLAALARVSTRYDAAIAPSPWTLPSTATLLTGLPPTAHGVVDHDRAVLPASLPTLAEVAREHGLRTAAVVTNDLLRPDAGYARGFDHYALVPYANARQVNHLAEAWWRANAGAPFLMLLHYWDPHHPFNAPDGWRDRHVEPGLAGLDMHAATERIKDRLLAGDAIDPDEDDVRFLRQRYLGDVAYLDHQLGELFRRLDASGLAASTAVVVTSDHGEEFLEHGLLGHGSHLFDETVRVPLFIAPAGALVGWADGPPSAPTSQARVVERVASTAGLFREILDLLGVAGPSGAGPGASTGGRDADADTVVEATRRALGVAFVETDKGVALGAGGDILRRPLRGLRSDTHLLVETLALPGEEGGARVCLYDLRSDPGARIPLPAVGDDAERMHRLLSENLELWARRRVRAPTAGGDESRYSALQALGYLHAVMEPGGGLPDCGGH